MEDIDLVKKALKGNFQARENLLTKYYDNIYSFVYKSIADQPTAIDVTQVVLMQMSDNLVNYRNTINFISFIFKIAVDNVIKHYKSRFHKQLMVDFLLEDLNSLEQTEISQENQDSKMKKVLQYIDTLKEIEKKIVILFYYSILEPIGISEVLDIPEENITKVKNKALEKLRKIKKR